MADDFILQTHDLTKEFKGFVAVNQVNLNVRRGSIHALIGPNGAGKTTLFNLIAGAMPPDSGTIRFEGRPIHGLRADQVCRAGIGRTFQHVKLVPDMTVLENVAMGTYLRTRCGAVAAMFRLDRAEERRALHEAELQLRRVGLAEQMHELAGNLALGPQRLVEIARALASDPALLLLDEPAAGLRHKEKQGLIAVLRQLRSEGMSILLVEHDMDFVMGLADRVVVMEFGRKLAAGLPEEIQRNPAVVDAYLGGVE